MSDGESTDENPEHFAAPLETYVQAYGISGGGVLVSYAIRAKDLQSGLRWTHMGRSIPLNPTGAWLRSEEGVLSAELDGLVPNREYRVSIELVEGTGEDARSRLVITESLTPTDTTHFLQRNISFANLERGEYRLVLRVTDALSGSAVQQERLVPVR